MQHSLSQVSRFLMQASLGADKQTIKQVAQTGIEPWLEQQLALTPAKQNLFADSTREVWQHFRPQLLEKYGEKAINGEGNNPALPYKWYFHMAWWQQALNEQQHLLRHRVALALSEILVISDNSALELDAVAMGSYYDLLYQHAFSDYSELLYQVSLHPCMGVYLSHMNNRKADKEQNIHPDENYAREIMQLFSIGLYKLYPNGERELDLNGKEIDSYNNLDIKELARVFTGLKAAEYDYEWKTSFWPDSLNGTEVLFEDGVNKTYKTIPFVNMQKQMLVEEEYHDRQPKRLLNGWINLPGDQDGKTEIKTVIERLVAHPNTAPFIARKLINQLVTSNPSKAYIKAVSRKFGPKGNLKAVIKEILTYPLKNAINSQFFDSGYREDSRLVQSQKLKSPMLRAMQILRAFNVDNKSGKHWLIGDDMQRELQQHPLSSPTVFNFYKPDFTPHGKLEIRKLLAPEFELHTSATSISYVNLMYHWMFSNYLPAVSTVISSKDKNVAELDEQLLRNNADDRLNFDWDSYIQQAKDSDKHEQLIDDLSLLLTARQTSPIKQQIKQAFANYQDNAEWVVQTIIFMLVISPEFCIQEA